jgi:hypothetical protein
MKRTLVVALVLGALACSGKDVGSGAVTGIAPADAQTPPTGSSAVDAWLAQGAYRAWRCEPSPHPARSPSPHGTNRICSNDVLSSHGDGEFPVGAAAVKEIYDGTAVHGYALYRKVGIGGGEAWYWYEKVDESVGADGVGSSGAPKSVCVGCHAGAGVGGHSGHDFVFTQVK